MSATQQRIILVGTNGTGKSTRAKKMIQAVNSLGKRALAVLPDDSEPLFRPYNEITQDELKYINRIATLENKIYFPVEKKRAKTFFDDVRTNFQNGILVLDDARFYVGSSRDEELVNVFIRSRQNNLHVLFICHGLSEIPPSLLTFTTKIVLLNTVDSWERLKSKIPNPNKFKRLVEEVRQRANNHSPNCAVHRKETCSCGAAYKGIEIDMKIDLIQSIYE